MLGPASIEFGSILIAEVNLHLALGVAETFPNRHCELSPVGSGKFEKFCQSPCLRVSVARDCVARDCHGAIA
jgi:hypothetical protein